MGSMTAPIFVSTWIKKSVFKTKNNKKLPYSYLGLNKSLERRPRHECVPDGRPNAGLEVRHRREGEGHAGDLVLPQLLIVLLVEDEVTPVLVSPLGGRWRAHREALPLFP